ncbi:prepilin-type N-terminal cleavage/methylation domain-containing protein [Oceanithermus sp.]|uniref:PilW family protein n=1 Tax=Oceanithermus sp. TaxID=2268145 RepID=UPI00257EB1DD|nr:prepilin-type N-terminal cleavage/methylation domain-containing protein [Oceanithermus sp.]
MRRNGFTLIELMISMAVFGVILILTTSMIVKNQEIANRQIVSQQAREDARLALLRVSELFSGAAYIYPGSQTLTLPDGTSVATGGQTLAMLLPWGSPYCNEGGSNPYDSTSSHRDLYCAVVYTLGNRSDYVGVLGENPKAGNRVLVEHLIKWVSWPVNTLPTRDFSGLSSSVGVVADAVVPAQTAVVYTASSLSQASRKPIDSLLLAASDTSDPTNALALIDNVVVSLGIRYRGQPLQQERRNLFARAVPRSAPPGTGN